MSCNLRLCKYTANIINTQINNHFLLTSAKLRQKMFIFAFSKINKNIMFI